MKNLFEPAAAQEVKERIARLTPDRAALWGKMNVAQALAHCASAFETPLGDATQPRMLIGRLIGRLVKPLALGDDKPMRRNSPTVPGLAIADPRDFISERARLLSMIERFVAADRQTLTNHPHGFFGTMTPEEWAVLMYKHLDHHLRQFGA